MPNRTPRPGRSSNVFTGRETPSTAIDPLGARNGASSAPASISTPCESPSGATAAILPTPSSDDHPSELQSLMRITSAVFSLQKKHAKIKQKKHKYKHQLLILLTYTVVYTRQTTKKHI